MKKLVNITLIAATLMITVFTSANAQSDRLIEANIPFNFMIKERALPAGNYFLSLVRIGGSDAVKIQSADGRVTAFVPSRSAEKDTQGQSKLVFNRYEDRYFLSSVYGLDDSAQKLARPQAEERLARNGAGNSTVSIAAHKH